MNEETNIEPGGQESAPQTETTENNVSHETSGGRQDNDLVDLAKYNRVKIGDQELTREQLQRERMFQSDYTKKTQEMAQERKYNSNLQADLLAVAKNPALASEFRRVYPAKYHGYLSVIQQQNGAANQSQSNVNPQQIEMLAQKLEAIEAERMEERVSQKSVEIDSAFSKYQSKFPLSTPNGDETYVLTRAQALIESGAKLDTRAWEKIFKDAHSHFESAYKGYYKTTNNNQKAAHVRGKDMAAGGGIAGAAPRAPRTLKEATKNALQDLASKN